MTAIANHPHRVSSAIAVVRAELTGVADVPTWSMDPTETIAALEDITRAEAQLVELKARLLLHADRTSVVRSPLRLPER